MKITDHNIKSDLGKKEAVIASFNMERRRPVSDRIHYQPVVPVKGRLEGANFWSTDRGVYLDHWYAILVPRACNKGQQTMADY